MTLELDGELFHVVEFLHVKPGKGGAFVRTTLKNAKTGAVLERTFRAGEKVERAVIDKRSMQYLYRDGEDFVFMDGESYEQVPVPVRMLGDSANYVVEGDEVLLLWYREEVVGVELPAAVTLEVVETEPGVQGDRVSGATKPAKVQTGLVVQVPLFVSVGDKIKVDTRTGEYLSRA